MKAFVINLKDSVERREKAAQQLSEKGIEHEFFEAWNGEKALKEKLFHWNKRRFLVSTGCPSAQGEIGCYASHMMLWKKCVELQRPILILEDDFQLSDNINTALALTDELIEQYGFIRLNGEGKRTVTLLEKDGFTLKRYKKAPLLALAYALSPAAAAKLLANFDEYMEPLDYYLKRFWATKQRVYHLSPDPITHNEHSDDTTITARGSNTRPLDIRLLRLWDQIANGFMRDVYNLAFAIHNLLRPNNRI